MGEDSEAALCERLRAGEVAAFDVIFERYRPRIYGFLVRSCPSAAVAEELTQETFIRLARTAARLRPDTRLGVWLFVVARNLAVSHRRWAVLDHDRLASLARLFARRPARSDQPDELSAAAELGRRLEGAIQALPLTLREVVLLVGGEGLTPAEASSVLGLTPEVTRQRLARGRQRLRELLGEAGDEPRHRRRA
jgi:RNA polymerase sigma-70 factor (ECF subfamily)